MPDNPVNLYKQIILHILHRSSLSLAQSVILDIITALGYTDYIQAQSALGDLVESGLVAESNTYHRTYLELTDLGEETRKAFEDQLSINIRKEIDAYLKDNHIETLNETSLVSDYRLTKDGSYIVDCSIRDGSRTVYELSVEVADENDAIRICDEWETKSEAMYAKTLQILFDKSESNNSK